MIVAALLTYIWELKIDFDLHEHLQEKLDRVIGQMVGHTVAEQTFVCGLRLVQSFPRPQGLSDIQTPQSHFVCLLKAQKTSHELFGISVAAYHVQHNEFWLAK